MCNLSVVMLLLHSPRVVDAWTGEIRGRVVCDVCGDSSIGPEDHFLEGIYLDYCHQFHSPMFLLCNQSIQFWG